MNSLCEYLSAFWQIVDKSVRTIQFIKIHLKDIYNTMKIHISLENYFYALKKINVIWKIVSGNWWRWKSNYVNEIPEIFFFAKYALKNIKNHGKHMHEVLLWNDMSQIIGMKKFSVSLYVHYLTN